MSLWLTWSVVGQLGGLPALAGLRATPPAAWCAPDAREPDDARRQAREIGGDEVNATLCVGEEDWHRLRLARGDSLTIEWRGGPARAAVTLYAPRRRRPSARFVARAGHGQARFTAHFGGIHRLRVRHLGGPAVGYALRLSPRTRGLNPAPGGRR